MDAFSKEFPKSSITSTDRISNSSPSKSPWRRILGFGIPSKPTSDQIPSATNKTPSDKFNDRSPKVTPSYVSPSTSRMRSVSESQPHPLQNQRTRTPSLPGIPDSRYKMNHLNRGRVAIFIHKNYTEKKMTRTGADLDVSRLYGSLPKLGFQATNISVYFDYTAEKIKQTLKKLSEENHTNNDCLFLFVLTHGSSMDIVYAQDKTYSIQDIWAPFLGNQCKTLIGKPKFFFIVACRGENVDSGVKIPAKTFTQQDLAPMRMEPTFTIPSHADILTVYSTTPGNYSYREEGRGTWYIEAFCREVNELRPETVINFTDLLTSVNRRLATAYTTYNPQDRSLHEKKQCAMYTSTLTKNAYFVI